MNKNLHRTLLATATVATISSANAVPIYQSNQVTLYMEGYFTAHMVNSFGDTQMEDGASRIRIGLNVPAYDEWDTGFNLEWGVRAINSAQNLVIQGDQQAAPGDRQNSLFLRQGHLFAKHPTWGDFSMGKQWGVYYEVTYITDWYNVSGGLASGTYGLNSDGGSTGTGRADSALAWRKSWDLAAGEFKIGFQYAAHTADFETAVEIEPDRELVCPPSDCEFGISHGISAGYLADIGDGLYFGVAYNRVKLDIASQDGLIFDTSGLEPVLIDDSFSFNASSNTWASAIGTYYGKGAYEKGFYGAVVVQRSQNNQLAPQGSVVGITNFFDARGSESFLSYTWGRDNCYSFYGGHNYLESDDPEFDAALVQGNQYRLEQYYLGFQYRWNERVRIYFENAFDSSNVVAKPEFDNFNAIGIRIDI